MGCIFFFFSAVVGCPPKKGNPGCESLPILWMDNFKDPLDLQEIERSLKISSFGS